MRYIEKSTYLLLGAVNLAIGCFLIYGSPPAFVGDAVQYYEIAKALVGKGGELSYDRSAWGYPIFLILTGVPWSRWPVITQVLQVCMASAIPYLVGLSLRQVGAASWISIAAAILSFLTMPTLLSVQLLTDTCGEFLFYLTIWLVARALAQIEGARTEAVIRSQIRWKLAAGIGATFFIADMVRPANALLGLMALGAGVAVTEKASRGVLLQAIGVLIMLTLAWVPLQKGWTVWAEVKAKQTFQTEGGWAGLLFFRNVYSAGSTFVGRSTIRPENGRCSSLVYQSVERRDPAAKDDIFAVHNDTHLVAIWKSVEGDFGPKEMDRLFWCAAFEGIYAEPKSLLYVYDGLVSFFLFDSLVYVNGYREAWPSVEDSVTTHLPFWRLASYGGEIIKVIALLVAFATLIPTWQRGGPRRALAAMVWTMILSLAAVHVVFASAEGRYIMPAIPGLVLLAGLGLDTLKKPSGCVRIKDLGSGLTSSN